MTTSRTKVCFLTNGMYRERAEFITRLAPPELEVTLVDNGLPDEEKIPSCKDAQAIMLLPADLSIHLLKSCPELRLIQSLTAGYDRLDVDFIGDMGIPIANNGGANAIAVAEHTIALMVSVCKRMMVLVAQRGVPAPLAR